MKKRVRFNINNYVWVKLTPIGLKVLEKDWSRGKHGYKYTPKVPDSDGYTKWQLWDLMNRFGFELHNGFNVPFETDIYFEKKDLNEKV